MAWVVATAAGTTRLHASHMMPCFSHDVIFRIKKVFIVILIPKQS